MCLTAIWKGGGYGTFSGASMAGPHVAAGAVLYLASNAGASPDATMEALLDVSTA